MTDTTKIAALHQILKQHPGLSSKAQCARLRAALSEFSVTTFEAMRYLDVYYPPARVMQLRNQGEAIDTHWETVVTEAGERHRVGRYTLRTGGGARA
jgi:hypothetical protein